MTRWDWWVGIAAVVIAILLHAAFPRYESRHVAGMLFARIDRWTGTVDRAPIGPTPTTNETASTPSLGIASYTPATSDKETLEALGAAHACTPAVQERQGSLWGLGVYLPLLVYVLYALANNWTLHLPDGSGRWRRVGVLGGYLLLVLFCFFGIIGSLGLKAP